MNVLPQGTGTALTMKATYLGSPSVYKLPVVNTVYVAVVFLWRPNKQTLFEVRYSFLRVMKGVAVSSCFPNLLIQNNRQSRRSHILSVCGLQ